MSEYQYIEFRAVDRPLTDAELEFAAGQSTRADISRWSFTNEYHYGDFHGDVDGLLKHGYSAFLHYANYGTRTVAFRFPGGLPFSRAVLSQYFGKTVLTCKQDRKGSGCIVLLDPYNDDDRLEQLWSPGEYMDDVLAVRKQMLEGDLRALYVLWLCAALDANSDSWDVVGPPIPGGLAGCLDLFGPFLEFFGHDPLILLAAAEGAPDAPDQPSTEERYGKWVKHLSKTDLEHWVHRLLSEDANAVKSEIVALTRHDSKATTWPTSPQGRSLQSLFDSTDILREAHNAEEQKKQEKAAQRAAAKKERERQQRMVEMAKDPTAWLQEATKLVDARGTTNYKAAADLLADLREAIGGEKGETIARAHAAHLMKEHPTLTHLKGSFRKRGMLS